MQNTNNIIFKVLLAVFAAFLATGCFFEKMAMPEDLQSVLIQVNVSADEMATKATPTSAEKAINTIRIYAFRDGQLSGHYYSSTVVSGQPVVMDLRLPETGVCDLDFYVIANETSMTPTSGTTSLSESTTEEQLASFAFSAFGAEDGSLPMYGKATVEVNVAHLSSEKNTEAGHTDHYYITDGTEEENIFTVTLSIERPVAKVSFYVATPNGSADQVYLNHLTMLSKGTRQYGYLFPQNASVLQSIPPTGNGINFVPSSFVITGTASSPMPVFENRYFFEVPYGSTTWDTPNTDNSVVFDLSFTGGEGAVNMPPIERNHHYKVTCTFPPGEGSIDVSYVVADWEDVEEWTLDFGHPTYSNPVQRTGNHSATGGPATMYFTGTEEGAFCVDFQMTAPAGQKWMPTFFGNAADYMVKVYETGTSTVVTPPVTVSDKWYTIKIIPLKQENVGSVVQFGITYTPSWTTDPEFLIINSGTVWNNAGSTEDLIVVQQVENNI